MYFIFIPTVCFLRSGEFHMADWAFPRFIRNHLWVHGTAIIGISIFRHFLFAFARNKENKSCKSCNDVSHIQFFTLMKLSLSIKYCPLAATESVSLIPLNIWIEFL